MWLRLHPTVSCAVTRVIAAVDVSFITSHVSALASVTPDVHTVLSCQPRETTESTAASPCTPSTICHRNWIFAVPTALSAISWSSAWTATVAGDQQTTAAPSYTVHHSPPPVSRPLFFLGPLPYQHVYQPSPSPVQRLPWQKPETKLPVLNPAAPAHHSPSRVCHTEKKVQEDTATDFKRLTNEFPFVYSFAKQLPYIFGNLEDDGD